MTIKERSKERQIVMHSIDLIEAEHCAPCPISKSVGNHYKKCEGCNHFKDIKKLGTKLDQLSKENKKVPEELNKSTYILLSDRGWTNHQIRAHYKINGTAFYFFLESNGLTKSVKQPGPNLKIALTEKEYYEHKRQGKSDDDIRLLLGVHLHTLSLWKKRNEIVMRKTSYAKRQEKEVEQMSKLSIEMYQDFRAAGMKDKEIAKRAGVTITALYQFKTKNKLTNKRSISVEVAKEVSKPVEAAKKISESVEPVNTVKEKPKAMPTIESNWNPLQDSINCYYENHSEKSDELKEKAKEMVKANLEKVKIHVVSSEPVANEVEDKNERIMHEYKVDKLIREIELHKELKEKSESQLRLYVNDYQSVVDEREQFKKRLEILLPEMEDLQTMNLIMMKKMISVDTVLKERGF